MKRIVKYPDPLRGIVPNSLAMEQSGNSYGYTMNNPINNADLNGNFIIKGLLLLGGSALVLSLTGSSSQQNYSFNPNPRICPPSNENDEDSELMNTIATWMAIDGPADFFRNNSTQTRWGHTTVNPEMRNIGRGFQTVGWLLVVANFFSDIDEELCAGTEPIEAVGIAGGRAASGWAGGKAGAAIGALGGPFAPITVPVGAILGAWGGVGLFNSIFRPSDEAIQRRNEQRERMQESRERINELYPNGLPSR